MTGELFVVELKGLPLDVHLRAEEHNLTLQRELALVHAADQSGSAPARLLWLSERLRVQFAAFNAEPQGTLQRAIEEGRRQPIDLRYEVPAEAAGAAEQLEGTLDEVDDFCRQGDLLTLASPAEALAYRRWFLGEFSAQIREGAAPTPWSPTTVRDMDRPDGASAAPAEPATASTTGDTALIVIDDDLDLEGAAAVRGDLADLLDRGVVHLIIDLAGCQFIDSVGISLLLTTRERLSSAGGGSLVVTNASGMARRTLETTGVYDILTKVG